MLASSPVNSSPTILNPAMAMAGGGNHISSTTKYLAKQDREALLQYTKHFVRKAVQIIVQSRLGDKKPTKSRVYAYNADWFNLSVKDLAQITTMTKASLGNVEAIFASAADAANAPFCVEISLRTPENQTMILETWCILFNEQLADPTQKICYSVYKKMSLVLRSLICLTRSIPTYQLSRRQNSDTYVLLYRMYCGEPIVHHLGENYGTAKVGTVGTPIGSLIVNVAYRTRLTMTPQSSSSEYVGSYGGIQIKDDHFTPNSRTAAAQLSLQQQQSSSNFETPPNQHHQQYQQPQSPYHQYHHHQQHPPQSQLMPTYDDDVLLTNNNPNNANNTSNNNYSPPPPQQQTQLGSPLIGGGDNRSPRLAFGGGDSQTAYSSSSPISRHSSSNLNTIAESTSETPTRPKNMRTTSKTQPIPMKSSQSQPHIGIGSTAAVLPPGVSHVSQQQARTTPNTTVVGQRNQTGNNNNNQQQQKLLPHQQQQQQGEESSADEYSSSVGSTSDTIYYFKLKSAAFVPSSVASFSALPAAQLLPSAAVAVPNNQSLTYGNDLPPFIALLSNDFANLAVAGNGSDMMAQSPPPPNNLIDFGTQQQQQQQKGFRIRNASNIPLTPQQQQQQQQDERVASPSSLPNFKTLDNQYQFMNTNNSNNNTNQLEPDDFVFIESKKIAFGLSNAADDLRNFFRACENAPMLDSFQNEPLFNDILKDLDQQLLTYESKVAEFDELIKSLENT